MRKLIYFALFSPSRPIITVKELWLTTFVVERFEIMQ